MNYTLSPQLLPLSSPYAASPFNPNPSSHLLLTLATITTSRVTKTAGGEGGGGSGKRRGRDTAEIRKATALQVSL